MPNRLIAPAALLLALTAAACDVKVGEGGFSIEPAQGKANDEWKRSYTLAAGGKLEISNSFGNIEVFAAKGPQVEVTAARELRMRTPEEAQAALKDIQMIESVSADSVRIETPTQESSRREQSRSGFLTVNYRVGVPAALQVTLKTENGQISVEKVDSGISATTTNGNVTARGVSGPLEATTVNGGVTVDIAGALKGNIIVNGVNGGVRLNVETPVDAELDLSAVNGGVSVDEGIEKMLSTSKKDRTAIRGRLNQGGPRVAAHIVNGVVRVTSDSR